MQSSNYSCLPQSVGRTSLSNSPSYSFLRLRGLASWRRSAGVVCRSRVFSSDSNERRLTIAGTSCYTVALDEAISLDLRASRIKHIERTPTNERISVGVCLYSVIGDGAPWLITPDIRFACWIARKDRQNNYSAAGPVERPSSS